LLSDVSHYPSVVIGPGLGQETVHGVYLVQLAASVVLAVIVAESGRVSREIVRLNIEPTTAELESAEQVVEQRYSGKTVAQARADGTAADAGQAPDRVIQLVNSIGVALARAEGSSSDIYVGGTSQLAALWEDLANVSSVLGILEEDTALRGMLGGDATEGTMVRIGAELNVSDLDLAVVSTTYGAGDQGSGRVGVIGPMRMDYRRTIKIVEEVGDGLADSLGT